LLYLISYKFVVTFFTPCYHADKINETGVL
jgi:hypothetical protein